MLKPYGPKSMVPLDEQIYIAEMDERYKQHAGFSYSEGIIERLVRNEDLLVQRRLSTSFRHKGVVSKPRSKTLRIRQRKNLNQAYNLRNEKIISRATGLPETPLTGAMA